MGGKENIIAVIGDGSMSGGEALEGLNVAGDGHLIVIEDDDKVAVQLTGNVQTLESFAA